MVGPSRCELSPPRYKNRNARLQICNWSTPVRLAASAVIRKIFADDLPAFLHFFASTRKIYCTHTMVRKDLLKPSGGLAAGSGFALTDEPWLEQFNSVATYLVRPWRSRRTLAMRGLPVKRYPVRRRVP
jgi:hypothetical protein